MSTKAIAGERGRTVASVERREGDEVPRPSELNLKQVAASLGVHYMTAYRYVRQGRLAARRVGTEWRVDLEALVAFTDALSRPDATGGADEGPRTQWSERLEPCLLAGDETAAWRVIESFLGAGHSPVACYLEVVGSALGSIGEKWAAGAVGPAGPYLANAVATRLVARLGARFRRPGRSRGAVIFGAPPGELHGLGIAIVSDLVRLAGFDVVELGANVPCEVFAATVVSTTRLVVVGVGVTRPELLDAAQGVVDAVRHVDADVPVLLGGLAATIVDGVVLRGVTAVAATGDEAVQIVEHFAGRASTSAFG